MTFNSAVAESIAFWFSMVFWFAATTVDGGGPTFFTCAAIVSEETRIKLQSILAFILRPHINYRDFAKFGSNSRRRKGYERNLTNHFLVVTCFGRRGLLLDSSINWQLSSGSTHAVP